MNGDLKGAGQPARGEGRFGDDRSLLRAWRRQVEAVLKAG